MQVVDGRRSGSPRRKPALNPTRAHAWYKFGGIGAAVCAEGAAGYPHPAIGLALAVGDVIIPLLVALVLLVAILRGSRETCERVFRLLRWIANRPEPSAPETPSHADVCPHHRPLPEDANAR